MSGNRSKSAFFEGGGSFWTQIWEGRGRRRPTTLGISFCHIVYKTRPILIQFCTYCPEYIWHTSPMFSTSPKWCVHTTLWSLKFVFFVLILMLEKRNSRDFDRQTDRITTPKIALAYARAIKTIEFRSLVFWKPLKDLTMASRGRREWKYVVNYHMFYSSYSFVRVEL